MLSNVKSRRYRFGVEALSPQAKDAELISFHWRAFR
jgi:hypothetical protein